MASASIQFSGEAKDVFSFLAEKSLSSKKERMLFDSIRSKIEVIRQNPYYGDNVPKRLIPGYYKEKYKVKNLFRVELPLFWRMLYSISGRKNEVEIIAFIIEILDHKRYNKRFGYKKN